MKASILVLSILCIMVTACSIPAGRRDQITVNKPFSVVSERIAHGVRTELEHGMTLTEDTVISRRFDLSDNTIHFQLAQHAFDIGTRAPFGNIYVRKPSPSRTLIDVVETPQTYGSEPYLADKFELWFPGSTRIQLPLPRE
jgi:hypothetical protein